SAAPATASSTSSVPWSSTPPSATPRPARGRAAPTAAAARPPAGGNDMRVARSLSTGSRPTPRSDVRAASGFYPAGVRFRSPGSRSAPRDTGGPAPVEPLRGTTRYACRDPRVRRNGDPGLWSTTPSGYRGGGRAGFTLLEVL